MSPRDATRFLLSLVVLLGATAGASRGGTPARVDQVQGDAGYARWQRALETRQGIIDAHVASTPHADCGSGDALRQAELQAHEARLELLRSLRAQGLTPAPPPPGVTPWPWGPGAGGTADIAQQDRDNVSVLVDDGHFVYINLRGVPEVDPALAAQTFYETHDDEYDFLVLFTDFNSDLFEGRYRAYHLAVANEITGLGYQNTSLGDAFNDRRRYTTRTPGVLQSFLHLNNIHHYPENPDDMHLRSYSGAAFMMHELAHRWSARLRLWLPLLGPLPVLLGRADVHWGFFANAGGSFNDGVRWVAEGDGFRSVQSTSTFGPLDLYLMGVLEPAEVEASELFFLESPTDFDPAVDALGQPWNPWSPPQDGVFCRATRRDFDMDGIFLGNGVRRPVAPQAPTRFTAATVLVVAASGSPDLDSEIAHINAYQERLAQMFHQETLLRGSLDLTLHSVPAAVDIAHVPRGDVETAHEAIEIVTGIGLVPRSLPTSLDDLALTLHYSIDDGAVQSVPMLRGTDDAWRASIPAQATGSVIDYWLRAVHIDTGYETTLPPQAPDERLSFEVAPDLEPPVIAHIPVDEHASAAEPLLLRAQVRDGHALDLVQLQMRGVPGDWVAHAMQRAGTSDVFETRVTPPGRAGTELEYRILARDAASTPHQSLFPASGTLPLRITTALVEDAETENLMWTHRALKKNTPDQWHRKLFNRTPGGARCWKLGPVTNTSNPRAGHMALDMDAALQTPAMRLTQDWSLTFYHAYFLRLSPPDTDYTAVDGAVVEWQDIESAQDVQEDRWYPIAPVGGYPNRLANYAWYNPLKGRACWAGDRDAWQPVRIDRTGTLQSLSGRMVRFRFRCATTPMILYDAPHAGWYLDDISIDPGGGPTAIDLEDLRVSADADGVELRWTARDVVEGESFRIERAIAAPVPVWQRLDFVPGRVGISSYTYRDTKASRAVDTAYRVTLVRNGIDIASQVVQVRGVPYRFRLAQNVPNPFNPATRIAFELAERQQASLVVYDVRGRQVRTLAAGVLDAGPHRRDWDGTDDGGRRMASGVYLVRLMTRGETATRRMLLLQ